jgi:3-ketosteroid 9alpha-monooxygenase subunit B
MFHSLRVARIIQETADARSIVLDVPPSLSTEFLYRAGQFITVEIEHEGERLRRCYSLASSPDCQEGHKFTVKKVAGGRVSTWLNERLREGDTVSVMRPEGRFVLDASEAPLLLVAGGSGITPVISIFKTALETTMRSITLLYANRDARSVIFERELERLHLAHVDRVRVFHRLDDKHGVLDEKQVQHLANGERNAQCYLCGPGPFMALVERALANAGWPGERIKIERFTLAAQRADGAAAEAAPATAGASAEVPDMIEVHLRGEKHVVPYAPGKTLLQTARDAGLDAPYSCEEGFCGCCASDLLEGKVVMAADDALSIEEKKRGMILACQSRPLTKRCAFRFVD